MTVAGLIVMAHDQLIPIVASSGADFSSIAAMVPNWAWPIVLVGVTGLLQYFRNLADSRGARDA